MAFIGTPHVIAWLERYRTMHRTVQQGQMIVCPHKQKPGHPAAKLIHRVTSTTHCPFCRDTLAKPVPIRDEKGEYAWPSAA